MAFNPVKNYASYEAFDSTATRCLGLVERHAARFMRLGGSLPRETGGHHHRMMPEQRAAILAALIVTGGRNQAEIGQRNGGFSQAAVYRVWRKHLDTLAS